LKKLTYLALLLPVLLLSACGEDRGALATKTVKDYWYDIGHGRFDKSYALLTTGIQASQPPKSYQQNMYGFLTHMGGVSAKTGRPEVAGDRAVVSVSLSAPGNPAHLNAYQHLFWENSGWRISDENGGLSRKK